MVTTKRKVLFIVVVILLSIHSLAVRAIGQSDEIAYLKLKADSSVTCICDSAMDYYLGTYGHSAEIIDSVLALNSKKLRKIDEHDFLYHELTRVELLFNHFRMTDEAFQVITELNHNPSLVLHSDINKKFNSLMGHIMFDLKRFDEAKNYYEVSFAISLEQQDSVNIKGNLINIGLTYTAQNDLDSALYYYDRAKELENLGILTFKRNLANNIAEIYYNKKQYSKVITIMEGLIVDHLQKHGTNDAGLNFNLASAYIDSGLYKQSIPILNLADSLAESDNDLPLLLKVYQLKKELFIHQENYESVYRFEKLSDSLSKLMNLELADHKLNELESEYQLNLNALKLEKSKEEAHHQRYQKRILIMLFVAVLFLVLGYLYFLRYKMDKKMALVKANLDIIKSTHDLPQETVRQKKREIQEVPAALINDLESVLIENKLFQNPDVSVSMLAKKMKCNSTWVSNTINDHYEMSFRELINSLRIQEARKILADSNFDHYSIEGISQMVGYKNISSFNVNFKKITGITPSYFKNKAHKLQTKKYD